MSVMKRNAVHVSGEGPPVMFAHGFGCSQEMWRAVAPAFADRHTVVLFDHVGSGSSDLSAHDRNKYSRLDGYAEDVIEICEELDLRNVMFVGHSVSAIIGVLAALRAPDRISSLVLIGPSPRYIDDEGYRGGFSRADIEGLLEVLDSNYLGWAATMAPVIMGAPERPELTEELESSFCRTDPDIAQHFAHVTFLADNREDLAKVRVPALVIQCAVDAIAPVEVGQYVHRQIPGSSFELIETTGHCPHLSAPAETIAAIERFASTR